MEHKGTKRLETDRLILRRFIPEDAESMYHNWASDPEVSKYLTWPTHPNVEVTKSLVNDWITRYENPEYYNWVIELKENGEAVGNISVVEIKEKVDAAVIGYCMGQAWWGRGIMPEALTEVMRYLFDEVGMNRVAACHDANNPKSGRVMQKAGMKYEGILRGAGRNNQGIVDEVWYGLLKKDR
ncbi:MAG: GNAT family N-acetyltransferase [Lachnospiraceae bacterium]